MTTFQDPPPQSRRSARQSERNDGLAAPADFGQYPPADPQAQVLIDAAHAPAEQPVTADTAAPATSPAPATAPAPAPVPASGSDASVPPATGRRSRSAAAAGLVEVAPLGEPLEYMTHGHAPVPTSEHAPEPAPVPASVQETGEVPPVIAGAAYAAPRPTAAEPAPFRVRDFSPEGGGRRSAVPPLIEPDQRPSFGQGYDRNHAQTAGDLDYRTQAAPSPAAVAAAAAAATTTASPAAPAPSAEPVSDPAAASSPVASPLAEPAEHQTLSRRELRQRQAEKDALAADPADQPGVQTTAPQPAPLSQQQHDKQVGASQQTAEHPYAQSAPPVAQPAAPSAASLAAAPAPQPYGQQKYGQPQFGQPQFGQPQYSQPVPSQPVPPQLVPPQLVTTQLVTTQPAAPQGAQSTDSTDSPDSPESPEAPAAVAAPQTPASFSAGVGTPQTPASLPVPPPSALDAAMEEFESLTQAQPDRPDVSRRGRDTPVFIEPELERTGGYVPPSGHWSRQADLDDETQPWENTITREVGGGNVATTTSALVLPEIPRPNDFPTALNSTGEILLTGSINLPASLGSVGGDSRHFDDSNVDLMFDAQDGEFSGTDSSPVRAIRAVSTHTSARGVIHANKPHGNRMLTVLLISASVMAAGVVALLVASFVLKLF